MVRIVQKYQFKTLKNHETAMVSMVLSMSNIRVVHLDFRRGFIACPAPQLQWQPAVSWSALTPPPPPHHPKKSQNSLCHKRALLYECFYMKSENLKTKTQHKDKVYHFPQIKLCVLQFVLSKSVFNLRELVLVFP